MNVKIITFWFFVITAANAVDLEFNECLRKTKCGECLSTRPECHWCADVGFKSERCNTGSSLTSLGCQEIFAFQNQIEMISSLQLRYPDDGPDPNPIQMKPKNVTLRMRPNSIAFFDLDVNQVVNQNATTVKITHDLETDSNIRVVLESSCLSDKKVKTDRCEAVAFQQKVNFNVSIETSSCPVDVNKRNQTFLVKAEGFDAFLTVNIQFVCDCECEKQSNKEVNSSKCNGNGNFECGICSCNSIYFGRTCECPGDGRNECSMTNDTIVCSGRGMCVCGICECMPGKSIDERIYGKYCECDDYSCPRFNKTLCAGHGRCECGICVCEQNWFGYACETPMPKPNN